jgi:phosphomannomutase
MIKAATIAGLVSVGIDVIDIGIVPTPTVEIAVTSLKARGGICITASHNPAQWNALKFFNDKGEFISPAQYKLLDGIFRRAKFPLKKHDKIGRITYSDIWAEEHIKKTLSLKTVNTAAIKRRKFKIVVDAVNGAGSYALPALLEMLGVKVERINCKGDGDFVHEPEPVPKNLTQLCRAVKRHKADLGMACDPDADRLALVDGAGRPIGEELTLSIAVKAILAKKRGPTVINLSTSKTTEDVARSMGSKVHYSKVGEANVVQMMHARRAIIGGEGNGGVIYPGFHAGRDSLVAAALVLDCLAAEKKSLAELVATLPEYHYIKTKGNLVGSFGMKLKQFKRESSSILGKTRIDSRDGYRFDFKDGWIQIRTSNTEPIYRLIVETRDRELSEQLLRKVTKYFK